MSQIDFKAAADFGHSLFKNFLEDNEQSSNCVISPVSVFLCMSMLERGAEGATKSEILSALCTSPDYDGNGACDVMKTLKDSSDTRFTLTTANGLFCQKGFEPLSDFVSSMLSEFNAEVDNLDFGSLDGVKKVNDWAEKETNGKIKEVIDQPDDSTIMALVSAVYMKGMWDETFDKESTTEGDFRVSLDKTVKADMMQQTEEFRYIRNDDAKFSLAFFPYLTGDSFGTRSWEMGILLPDFGLAPFDFVEHLRYESLKELRDKADGLYLNVRLPKFKVEASIDLIPMMRRMEVKSAFTDNADFSKISDKEALKVSKMLQKCFVDVDEEGTEAAAITAVKMVFLCARSYGYEPIKFHVTSPFLFCIRHVASGVVLFCGCVNDPTA